MNTNRLSKTMTAALNQSEMSLAQAKQSLSTITTDRQTEVTGLQDELKKSLAAHNMGSSQLNAENEQLRRYYPDRTAWMIEPDAHPPKLTPYQAETPTVPSAAAPAPQAEPTSPKPKGPPPPLQFEPVPEAKH